MLTKSDYMRYRECPIHCWLHKRCREEFQKLDDEAQQRWRKEQGDMVEDQARRLFPEGQLIVGRSAEAISQTNSFLASGVKTIFQATGIADGRWAMADVLRFDPETSSWQLFEVKSSTRVNDDHLHDVGFQRLVFRRAGLKIGACFVIHVNAAYVRRGEIDPREFLVTEDVTSQVEALQDSVDRQAAEAMRILALSDPPGPAMCTCHPKNCPCAGYCFPELPEHSVFTVPRLAKARQLYNSGIRRVHDLPRNLRLSERQKKLVFVIRAGRSRVDKPEIRRLLNDLRYPLQFLDYETWSPALPMYDGYSPYQQMVFQYSLHVVHEPGAEPEHREYLVTDHGDPAAHVVQRLASDLHPRGNVVVWNKTFETTRNKELASRFPEFAELLHGVNERIFDLMDVFRRQHFIHPEIGGSDSIKKILPVLVPHLSYCDLAVRDGATASLTWYQEMSRPAEERIATSAWQDLRAYCRLDTLAMVELLRRLEQEIGLRRN